jgi:4-diphosphocytidyl-2-C-methyl-D-erythritol kinase
MDETANNTAIKLHCPAKLNLTLAVAAPRLDGLHPIASVMVAMDFGDVLKLAPCSKPASTFTRSWATDAPKPHTIDWPIEEDLVYRAHALLEAEAGRRLHVHCDLIKRVPAGAGLGGGSSNAAAMLAGLRQLYDLDVNDETLLQLAEQLGADVVFLVGAILGQSAALVTGIGEVITPINSIPAFDCVLVFPDGQCPTAAVYRAFDERKPGTSIDESMTKQWTAANKLPAPCNDLFDAAVHVCPAISPAIQAMQSQKIEPRLTGSGSALFGITESKEQAVAIAEAIRKKGTPACPASYTALS